MKHTSPPTGRNAGPVVEPLVFDGLLTTEQAATYLSVSPRWLQMETAAGRIKCLRLLRPGKTRGPLRYRREDLDAYIASCGSNAPNDSNPT